MLEGQKISASFANTRLFAGLSVTLPRATVCGLYGPSGSGKTTLARILAGLHRPCQGVVLLDQQPLGQIGKRKVQYLPQNPLATMNPRWRIDKILKEAGPTDPAMICEIGFDPQWLSRYPHELSGGQLQRISLLRALNAKPDYLIADEITAALDQISQAQLWQVLVKIVKIQKIGILAVSHDKWLLEKISMNEPWVLCSKSLPTTQLTSGSVFNRATT